MKKLKFSSLVDDNYRYHYQMILIPGILGAISFIMFVLNIFTQKEVLMYATLFYSLISTATAFFTHFVKNQLRVSYLLFSISVVVLFTYFLLAGGTEGFSPIWICLLPCCGMLLMGKARGTALCAAIFLEIIFLYWTPLGNSLVAYPFSPSFLMRFPIAYLSFFIVGFFFEAVRNATNRALVESGNQYREVSSRDVVTGIRNRSWFNEQIELEMKTPHYQSYAFLIGDVDDFKRFNDTYGHLFGDRILKKVAASIEKEAQKYGPVCRWGGEEFAVLLQNVSPEQAEKIAEQVRLAIQNEKLQTQTGECASVTISIGIACFPAAEKPDIEKIISIADNAMYDAKRAGKNLVVKTIVAN